MAWHWIVLLLIRYPVLFFLPTFLPPQHCTMAELAVHLTRLSDMVLEQFCYVARPLTFHSMQADVPQLFTANFRTKNTQLFSDISLVDLDHLQAYWITSWTPPSAKVGLDPRSLYGMDRTFGDATFDLYPAVNFDQPRSATPSSGYSFNPYNSPSSEFEYPSASGLSTPSSGPDFFDNNPSEPILDWGPSLAAFFNLVETPALESL
ncbi:hypothetical protein C8J57DRAFT_1220909 [Mycena rebaudengoi]|nr:hypothetical protein C8J57DRAFT_1220909 [Mycena rebaudengoi]